jgi:hypothetical protein
LRNPQRDAEFGLNMQHDRWHRLLASTESIKADRMPIPLVVHFTRVPVAASTRDIAAW